MVGMAKAPETLERRPGAPAQPRVGPGALHRVADLLGVPVQTFVAALPAGPDPVRLPEERAALERVEDAEVRARLAALLGVLPRPG